MKGMKKKLTSSKTANDPDSRINNPSCLELLMKTFQQFIGEAYSKSEKESHKVKPVKKEFL